MTFVPTEVSFGVPGGRVLYSDDAVRVLGPHLLLRDTVATDGALVPRCAAATAEQAAAAGALVAAYRGSRCPAMARTCCPLVVAACCRLLAELPEAEARR
eukprot:gene5457-66901_t